MRWIRSIFARLKPEHRWTLLLSGVGLGVAGAGFVYKIYHQNQDVWVMLVLGLILTYASAVFGFVIKSWLKLSDSNDKLDKLHSTIQQQTLLTLFTSRLTRTHEVIQKIGFDTFADQTSSLTGTDKGFIITGTNWAMRANTNFWRALSEFNASRMIYGSAGR